MAKQSYKPAWEKAWKALKEQNPSGVAEKTGACFFDDQYHITYLYKACTLSLSNSVFVPSDLKESEQILILHYLASQGTVNRTERFVTFKGLPGGMFYYPTYRKRGADWLLAAFGNEPEKLLSACRHLGGEQASFEDVSVKIRVLPQIDVVVVLHRGDEEFPPEISLLYRDDIISFLPLEDVAVLAGIVAGRLIKR